ncbi:hypothetical protein [Leptospira kirschneri]|uniref:Uncharacterized protein n=1 Tax=Leptospira kirschneri str. 200802841 TaxID=1193047 RepID=A0A828YA57_9LEPT|nr:hypothetical protein [Leptospira kirschneri]EKO53936.1 hypothetical protein LEP1GSC131_1575 [Leptospira kirschneri str. 200802841]
MKKQTFKNGVSLRLIPKEGEAREQDPRLEAFWNRFLKMSVDEKRKVVKRLFAQLGKYKKEKRVAIAVLHKHHQNEMRIERTLRMIGQRMRG